MATLKHFVHDCTACDFLGTFDGHDLYVHRIANEKWDDLVVRFGDDGPDYKSISNRVPTSDPHFVQAKKWARNGSIEELKTSGNDCVDLPELDAFFR